MAWDGEAVVMVEEVGLRVSALAIWNLVSVLGKEKEVRRKLSQMR